MADKTVHTWVVPNFSTLLKQSVNQSNWTTFLLKNDENVKFGVWMWPNGITSWEARTMIKMGIMNANNKSYQIRIAVISSNGEDWMATDGIIKSTINGNYKTYIISPELLIPHHNFTYYKNQVLPDDKLTIRVEVTEHVEYERIQTDLSSILADSTLSDVVCEVDNKQFRLHKVILAARSPVLKAMFTNNMLEARSNQFKLPDISKDAFEQALQFIYSDKVPDMTRFALELFTFADKYQMESLKTICMSSMIANMDVETVVDVLLLAELHNAALLKAKCMDFITNNLANVKQKPNWRKLNDKPNLLLELYNVIDLTAELVIDVLILADTQNDANLKQKCIEFIKANKDQVKQQPAFQALKNNKQKQQLMMELLMELI